MRGVNMINYYCYLDKKLNNKEEVLKFLAEKAVENDISSSENDVFENFLKREEEFSTGLQEGFAIPHCKIATAKKQAVIFLKLDKEIEWGTFDEKGVKYIFSIIIPDSNSPNEHLKIISNIAVNLLEDDFKESLKKLKSEDEFKKMMEVSNG